VSKKHKKDVGERRAKPHERVQAYRAMIATVLGRGRLGTVENRENRAVIR